MSTRWSWVVLPLCLAVSSAIQPGAAPAQPAQLRHLEFGDINFLHTTDTHGWHAGHLLEPAFSADWGDYISFSEHLRKKVEAEGKDLLIIDTGDRIEGNGLYDASEPRGEYTFGIFEEQHIDLLCSGNHELYKNSSAEDDYIQLVPTYQGNYLASNLQIIDPADGQLKPLAPTHRKFTTKSGIRILAFGFIFDFTRNDKNTVVTRVETSINQDWFKDAISDPDIDLCVVIGHVALRSYEFELIHHAIRRVHPNLPIQFFGGHFHIRDYRIFDDKSHAIASGRFMETIGFQSISNVKSSIQGVTFARRYIDNNLYSFYRHSNTTSSTFNTPAGKRTTREITRARSALNLDQTFGCATQPYWMSRSPYPASDSVFSLITDQIFPSIHRSDPDRQNKTRVMMTNTGAIRFDVFAGPFTRDSTFIVSPFTSNLSFIPDVPWSLVKKILPILNGGETPTLEILQSATFHTRFKFDLTQLPPPEQLARSHPKSPDSSETTLTWPKQAPVVHSPLQPAHQSILVHDATAKPPLTPGYTTRDDLGTDGDDTLHSPIDFYNVPNCIQAIFPGPDSSIPPSEVTTDSATAEDGEVVDLIFNEFLVPYILNILNLVPHVDSNTLIENENYLRGRTWQLAHQANKDRTNRGTEALYDVPECVELGLCPDRRIRQDTTKLWDGVLNEASTENQYKDEEDGRFKSVENKGTRLTTKKYVDADILNYVEGETFTSLLAKWVADNWKVNCLHEVEGMRLEL